MAFHLNIAGSKRNTAYLPWNCNINKFWGYVTLYKDSASPIPTKKLPLLWSLFPRLYLCSDGNGTCLCCPIATWWLVRIAITQACHGFSEQCLTRILLQLTNWSMACKIHQHVNHLEFISKSLIAFAPISASLEGGEWSFYHQTVLMEFPSYTHIDCLTNILYALSSLLLGLMPMDESFSLWFFSFDPFLSSLCLIKWQVHWGFLDGAIYKFHTLKEKVGWWIGEGGLEPQFSVRKI